MCLHSTLTGHRQDTLSAIKTEDALINVAIVLYFILCTPVQVTQFSSLSPSDSRPQDSLILEKNDMHHPVCSFQDDFQEFEMIDDEDEDDDEEEEEEDEEVDPDAPPSPSASPPPSPTLGTLKSRPTTLNLTTAVSQVSRLMLSS